MKNLRLRCPLREEASAGQALRHPGATQEPTPTDTYAALLADTLVDSGVPATT